MSSRVQITDHLELVVEKTTYAYETNPTIEIRKEYYWDETETSERRAAAAPPLYIPVDCARALAEAILHELK